MKQKIYLLIIVTVFGLIQKATSQTTYFTEYFDNAAAATITGTTANAATTPTTSTIGTGDWVVYYSFRSGTGCTPNDPVVASAKGLRILSTTSTTPAGLSTNSNGSNAYLITPNLNYGVNIVSWKNASTSTAGTISVYKSTDNGANWSLVQTVTSTGTGCADYSVTINSAAVNKIKFQNESGSNADLDNITITSTSTILPVTFGAITATKTLAGVDISWGIGSEINTSKYDVQKSVDGINFSAISTITANNLTKYSFTDVSPNSGSNYYRIKAIDKDGSTQYSSVVSVNTNATMASLKVYPNPIVNKQFNVQLSNLAKGTYSLDVYNTIGQIIYNQSIIYDAATASIAIQLPASIATGIYRLAINDGTNKISKTISVQ